MYFQHARILVSVMLSHTYTLKSSQDTTW